MASHKHRWKCPVCDKYSPPHELYVDQWFANILRETKEEDGRVYLSLHDQSISWKIVQDSEHTTIHGKDHEKNNVKDNEPIDEKLCIPMLCDTSGTKSLSIRCIDID